MRKSLVGLALVVASALASAADYQAGQSAYNAGDFGKALAELRPLAEQGMAKAQFALGLMYALGKGVTADAATAASWYRKSAEQGFAAAQGSLGAMYAVGAGVPLDLRQAFYWHSKAAEQGAAESQNALGDMYARGDGVQKDLARAADWYRKAADQSYGPAMESLSKMYAAGEGVQKDPDQARQLQNRATYDRIVRELNEGPTGLKVRAEAGDAESQLKLGAAYANGDGVQRDYVEAEKWFRKVAEAGHPEGQFDLGLLYEKGLGVQQDYSQAARWYQKSAEQNNADAQNNLGLLYADGNGVGHNYAWAVYWEARAAQNGSAQAPGNVETHLSKLRRLRAKGVGANVREKPSLDARAVRKLAASEVVYKLDNLPGWYEVYVRDGNLIGYVADSVVVDDELTVASRDHNAVAAESSQYPARPEPQPGRVVCATRCFNGDCYRTYSDGQHVHFQAQMKWSPMSQQMEYDSGSC